MIRTNDYGDGNVYKATDKRNPNNPKKLWLAKIRIGGKTLTAKFPRTTDDNASNPARGDVGYRDAVHWLRNMQREKRDGIVGSALTLREEIELYQTTYKLPDLKKGRLKLPSYDRKLQAISTIPASLLNMRITDIRTSDIKNALSKMEEKYAESTIDKAYDLMNGTFRVAVADDKIRKNPFDSPDIKRPSSNAVRREKREKEIFTASELQSMFSAIQYMETNPVFHGLKNDYYTLFLFLITSGARIGEALGAKWSDIRQEGQYTIIHIQRTIDPHYYAGKKGQRINTPKTESGERDIPLLDKQLLCRLEKLHQSKPDSDFIFETASGNALEHQNVYRTWRTIGYMTARECPQCHTIRPNDWKCECGHHNKRNARKCKCGIKRPTEWICPNCGKNIQEIHKNVHTTRHTFASYLAAHDVPINIIKSVLGHSQNDSVTERYIHLPENYIDILVDKLQLHKWYK